MSPTLMSSNDRVASSSSTARPIFSSVRRLRSCSGSWTCAEAAVMN
jgi:hypothetical protein